VWFSSKPPLEEPGLVGLIAAFLIAIFAGLLMVSSFSFPSFKKFDIDRRIKWTYMIIVPVFFILIAMDPPTMLFSIFSTYALSAPLLWVGRRIRRTFRGAPAGTT
jgi:CDP-diacylglycerol--serine O-phosphatidyltransferase